MFDPDELVACLAHRAKQLIGDYCASARTENRTTEALREDLEELDRKKADINRKADEKETDIRNISDVDSLRNEVARHYRR